jgi:twitching motility protein PilJ
MVMHRYRPYNMDGRKASESEGRRRPVILIMLPLAVLLVLVACSVLSSQSTLDSQYRSLVAEQGLLSKQIALLATQAAQGSSDSFETMRLLGLAFERNLQELLTGIPDTRGLETAAQLDNTQRVSRRFREQTQVIGQGKDVIIRTRENIDAFNTDYTRMLNLTDAVATLMVSHGMSADQVYISTRQLLILERISKNLERMLAPVVKTNTS